MDRTIGVQRHCSRLDGVCAAVSPAQALGEHSCHQSVANVVRQFDRLFLVVEGDDEGDRPEDLLLSETRRVGNVREDGRLHEIASFPIGRPAATVDQGVPLVATEADVLHRLGELAFRHLGADIGGRVERRSGHDARGAGGQELGELLDDPALDDQTAGLGARLAGRPESRMTDQLRGPLQIGVVENEYRSLAAALERATLQRIGGGGHDALGRRRATREGDLVDTWMSREAASRRSSITGDDVHYPVGEPGLLAKARQLEGADGRELGGLDDDRVPGGQCRT